MFFIHWRDPRQYGMYLYVISPKINKQRNHPKCCPQHWRNTFQNQMKPKRSRTPLTVISEVETEDIPCIVAYFIILVPDPVLRENWLHIGAIWLELSDRYLNNFANPDSNPWPIITIRPFCFTEMESRKEADRMGLEPVPQAVCLLQSHGNLGKRLQTASSFSLI